MDTKKLRQKILDLAIHGKLVPQDPNDEPASVLLERIRAEKERLVKEGKIKKSKSSRTTDTPHYAQVPFEIPSSWEWTTVGEIFTLQAGKNITAKDISDKEDTEHRFPCYGGNGLRGYVCCYNRDGRFPLIGRQGALCGNINLADGLFYATEHAVVVETYCETNVDWAVHTLTHLNLNQYATSTAQPGLSVSTINEVLIPLPPIEEQRRIVSCLNKWFALIAPIEQGKVDLQTTIKQTKSKILDLAIHGKLVSQDPSDEPASELLKRINPYAEITCDNGQYGKLPKGWCLCKLGDIGEIVTGSTPTKDISEYYGGIIPFYKPADLENGICVKDASDHLSILGYEQARKIPAYSILVTCIGATIGKTGLIIAEGSCNQQINAIIPNETTYAKFLYYTCISDYMQKEIKLNASATTLPILNKGNFAKLLFPLPPLTEQHRIVAKIEDLFSLLDNIQKSLEA